MNFIKKWKTMNYIVSLTTTLIRKFDFNTARRAFNTGASPIMSIPSQSRTIRASNGTAWYVGTDPATHFSRQQLQNDKITETAYGVETQHKARRSGPLGERLTVQGWFIHLDEIQFWQGGVPLSVSRVSRNKNRNCTGNSTAARRE